MIVRSSATAASAAIWRSMIRAPPMRSAALSAPPNRVARPPARIAAETRYRTLDITMSEPRIGRVLVASLHQSIADVLPARLEFYENWLNVSGLREGTIGLAPLSAVLSFLRTEGPAYSLITTRAGQYAGDWTVNTLTPWERRFLRRLPSGLRARAALRVARMMVRS